MKITVYLIDGREITYGDCPTNIRINTLNEAFAYVYGICELEAVSDAKVEFNGKTYRLGEDGFTESI